MITLHPRILELLSSRICHDLVSPVGAINNGIELMTELGDDAGGDAVDLISSSVEQAAIRLKCFRLAYGAAGSQGGVGFKDVHEIFNQWVSGCRSELVWDLNTCMGVESPDGFMKVLLNLLMFAEECNPGNGEIIVEPAADFQGMKITVTGRPAFRDGAQDALEGTVDEENLDARSVHAYITGVFAKMFSVSIQHSQASPEKLQFSVTF